MIKAINPLMYEHCSSPGPGPVDPSQWDDNRVEVGIKVNIRLHNYPESVIALKILKAAYLDKLVSGRGTLVKVSSTVKPLVVQMDFHCVEVQDKHYTHVSERKFSPPSKCDLDGWKSRNSNPIRSTASKCDPKCDLDGWKSRNSNPIRSTASKCDLDGWKLVSGRDLDIGIAVGGCKRTRIYLGLDYLHSSRP